MLKLYFNAQINSFLTR